MPIKLLSKIWERVFFYLNRLGSSKECYICKSRFFRFSPFKGGAMKKLPFIEALQMVGSDARNFKCRYCGANDRERHLFMFFEQLKLWNKMKGASILHFAPERHLPHRIVAEDPSLYVRGDLFPKDSSVEKIDATSIPYPEEKFDFVICNHVLEHIPEYKKAMTEIHRVLKKGGIAVLQTPYSKLLVNNFSDESIDSDEARLFFYGQRNHVRVFGQKNFFRDLQDSGFALHLIKNDDVFTPSDCNYYGVNRFEDLVMVIKET